MVRLLVLNVLLGLLTSIGSGAYGQFNSAQRLELPTRNDTFEQFDVTPLAEQGVLVTTRHAVSLFRSGISFQFRRFDSDLRTRWAVTATPDDDFVPMLSYHNEQYLYWLLAEPETDRILVMRLALDDGTVDTFDGRLIQALSLQQFKVMGNTAYIGGYHRDRPVVMAFSFFDRTMRVLPGIYANNTEISSLEIDDTRQEVHLLVHMLRRKCQFSLRSFSAEGKPLRTITFDGSEHSLVSGKLLPVSDQETLLIGNYSTDCTPYSQGIYVTTIRHTDSGPFSPDRLRFIEFSDLQNFFNYLKPKRQQKLLARIGKRRDQGKDTRFRYRLLVHDLLPTADGLTLLAEVYYPQYRGSTMPYAAGLPRRVDRYLEGYRYTHAFLCGFDRQGKLLWDNCLPIKDLTSVSLRPMVQVSQQGAQAVLAYPNAGQISTEVIRGNALVRETESYKLLGANEKEKVVYSDEDNLAAWFGEYFLAFGYQKLVAEKSAAAPREVFYLTKLSYAPPATGDLQPSLPNGGSASRKTILTHE